jgi:hypothetical protein
MSEKATCGDYPGRYERRTPAGEMRAGAVRSRRRERLGLSGATHATRAGRQWVKVAFTTGVRHVLTTERLGGPRGRQVVVEVAEMVATAVDASRRSPASVFAIPRHAAMRRGAASSPHVLCILGRGRHPQVRPAIVERIAVDVVHLDGGVDDSQHYAVHPNELLLAPFARTADCVAARFAGPSETGEASVLVIDDCHAAIAENDLHHGPDFTLFGGQKRAVMMPADSGR